MHTSPTFSETFRQFGSRERDRIFTDFSNLYSQRNVGNYGFAVLGAGVLANTSMDRHFQNWHGNHVRSKLTNEVSKVTKTFGEGKFFIPVMVTHALSYRFLQEKRCLPECRLGDFTDRTMRGYLVGAPTLLTMQLVLGGDRPNSGKSHWQPFQQDHGVSGHAFMGAVPFITAAQMTDDPYAKGLFYTLSISPAWSRVHDDVHYLSQAMLGWYLAYLSVRAISETEGHSRLPRGLTIFPVGGDDSVGIGLHYRY
jgi:membrane-associated phospholipid phosphatase